MLNALQEFNACIRSCAINNIITTGSKLTWCNNGFGRHCIWQVLDRVLQSSLSIQMGVARPESYIGDLWIMPLLSSPGLWIIIWDLEVKSICEPGLREQLT